MQPHLTFLLILSTLIFAGGPETSAAGDEGTFVQAKNSPPRGYLGVYTQDMTSRLARSMTLKTEEGALVTEVMEDTPAEKAGLQEEDIIVEFDGKSVRDAGDLTDAVRKTAPGTKVNIVVMRKDERKTLQAEVGKTRRSQNFGVAPIPPVHPRVFMFNRNEIFGMEVREIRDQLAKYFDAPSDEAVLVEEVEEKSDAASAGIAAGDVILKLGDRTIEDIRDLHRAVRNLKENDKVNVELLRRGTRKSVTLTVTDLPHEERFFNPPHGKKFFFRHDPDGDFDFDFDIDVNVEGLEEEMENLNHELEGLGGQIRQELRRAKEQVKSLKRWT